MSPAAEGGSTLVGILISLLLVGALAVVVVTANGGTPNPELPRLSGPVNKGSTGTQSFSETAAIATCRSDYQAVVAAVEVFRAVNGKAPTSLTQLSTYLPDSVASPYFTISLDPGSPGTVEVATPGHPSAAGDANCEYSGH